MSAEISLADRIDQQNLEFTSSVKDRLARLDRFDDSSLEWLMVEHYQFSKRNTAFLAAAADTATLLATPAVAAELRRNLAEENGHARMYRRALLEIEVDTELRRHFAPTAEFFETVSALVAPEPSVMLGVPPTTNHEHYRP